MKQKQKNLLINLVLATSDLSSFIIPFYIVIFIINPYLGIENIVLNKAIALHGLFAFILVMWYAFSLKHYSHRKSFWYELREVLKYTTIIVLLESIFFIFLDKESLIICLALSWFMITLFTVVVRVLCKALLDKLHLWKRETIIIGCGKNALDTYKAICKDKNLGYTITEFIAIHDEIIEPELKELPVKIRVLDSATLFKTLNSEKNYIVALESEHFKLREALLREFIVNHFQYVSIVPSLRGVPLYRTDISFIFSHEILMLHIRRNISRISSIVLKRIFDLVVSLSILIVLSPIMLFVFFKVRADGGPAFYGHERVGKDGKTFKCLKFRSMAINSKELLEKILATDPEARKEWEETFKLKDDPRVTKIGQFLRKSSLDELPQLFNILKGEMSLVGPRPITADELKRYEDDVAYYLMTKPGLTGLWQVSGRSDVDYATRIYFDAWYIKNWSLWNDLVIVLKTVKVVVMREGAY
ncbi:undecaprenyl-phosphate galactose phosphotransferase WbaP [Acinetobacter soli]|uniref:undecaprenyl-phosphate galactose phosphotransferase WbaP n=2 Tax=Acinetobacter soli TaxID=487316 RepID=UPI000DCFC1AC|nr:undecaprenyl-phosphate galactose phosphotransferase WbaP [Acinetobacter soli]MBO3640535.1 undecaprenyl-phosphate galactose phosphotransferase WbaP [Acinetobacter soli]MDQ9833108.1 undecaprenyl-phosphate galactose phosphotransferase WbaP [Acinetobacter soli]RSB53225.1 undecaprenyl-phosphate galactose phosphotransferase WbaP [Acinetobacter soli]WOQ36471.1 undecaprenyl-phosphate galactose phosphotransferase WbaP [Acinetobacter soli]